MKEVLDFLKEYEELCKKHDMWIHGCGCCDSPYLITREDKGFLIQNICFDDAEKKVICSIWYEIDGVGKTEWSKDIEQIEEILKNVYKEG